MAGPSSVDGNSSITRVGWSGFSDDDDEDDDVDDDYDDNVVVVARFFGGLPHFGLATRCSTDNKCSGTCCLMRTFRC